MTRNRLLVVAVVLAVLLGWFLWWRRPAVQAPRLFQRIAAALHDAKGGALIDQVHERYDIATHWPVLAEAGLGDSPERLRMTAQFAVQQVLNSHRSAPLKMLWTIDGIDAAGDDVVATVSLRLTTDDGQDPLAAPLSLSRHRFTLARRNWLGELAILAHAPITVTP